MLAAYLIGSIPTGVLVTRFFTGRDIRQMGSGNIGATNVRRAAGNLPGIMVLLGDMLKGTVPVVLSMRLPLFVDEGRLGVVCVALTALGAFFGHLYPIYLKGRGGGKGVATAAGCFLPISPVALAGAVLIFILVVWRWRVVSMGSLAAAAALPVCVLLQNGPPVFTALGVVTAAFIFLRHSGNIRRLKEGREPKI
jgi:glycerol-3-phosphate acyltransferase PlsY